MGVNCSGMIPTDAIVHELFMRMAGENSESITKEEFVHFLASLQGDIAQDRTLEAMSPPKAEDNQTTDSGSTDPEKPRTITPETLAENEGSFQRKVPGYVS